MPDLKQYRIGEVEGGVVLICPDCGHAGWHSGFIGGDTIAQIAARAAQHNTERHSGLGIGGHAAPITFTTGEDGNPQPQWPTHPSSAPGD